MYLNEILPGNWREDKWPEHIEVSHEASRFKSRRYVPRVNSANKSSANPVDGIWCSHCGWAGVIAQDMTDLDGCRIDPSNCPEYISCEDYHEQEEFYE